MVLEQMKTVTQHPSMNSEKNNFIEVPRKISNMEIQELREETSEGDGQK